MVLDPSLQVINNQLAYLISVTTPEGVKAKYYYDQKTGLKVKESFEMPTKTTIELSDYRTIDGGVKIPYTEKTVVVGQPIEFNVKSASVNTGLSNDVFK